MKYKFNHAMSICAELTQSNIIKHGERSQIMQEKLTFRIDSFTPDSLPMARLAEYLTYLSTLYGSTESVHFEKVKKGSAILQVAIDDQAFPKVFRRLQCVNSTSGDSDQDAKKAYKALDALLRHDNAVGTISRLEGAKILEFPGRKIKEPEVFTVTQPTSIDGMVIKIGGKDNTIPVTLLTQEGKTINCQIRGQANAKELSLHYLGPQLRVHGIAKWVRDVDGVWDIESLTIQSYEELDTAPLNDVLIELRSIQDNGWKKSTDPLADWKKMRGSE